MHVLFRSLPNSSACWEFWQENLPGLLLKWQKCGKDPHVFVCSGCLICLMVTEGWAFHWNSPWKSQWNVKQKLNSSWNFRWWNCDPSSLFPHLMLKLSWMWSVCFESWSCYSWPHPRVCLCHTETPLIGWHVLTSLHYLSFLFIKAYPSPLFNTVKKSVFRERGTSPTPGSCRVFGVSSTLLFVQCVCPTLQLGVCALTCSSLLCMDCTQRCLLYTLTV